MDLPIAELMDEDACYEKLVDVLHPDGLACPRCGGRDALKVHRRHRAPVLDYRCDACGRVFNALTGTAFHRSTHGPCSLRRCQLGRRPQTPVLELVPTQPAESPHLVSANGDDPPAALAG
jgi:DNA-directed RNA polymerase subunit RPC12/RpoP